MSHLAIAFAIIGIGSIAAAADLATNGMTASVLLGVSVVALLGTVVCTVILVRRQRRRPA